MTLHTELLWTRRKPKLVSLAVAFEVSMIPMSGQGCNFRNICANGLDVPQQPRCLLSSTHRTVDSLSQRSGLHLISHVADKEPTLLPLDADTGTAVLSLEYGGRQIL